MKVGGSRSGSARERENSEIDTDEKVEGKRNGLEYGRVKDL